MTASHDDPQRDMQCDVQHKRIYVVSDCTTEQMGTGGCCMNMRNARETTGFATTW
jgi:hypothetical protein